MSALSADRATKRLAAPDGPVIPYGVKANAVIHGGAMVQLDATGYLIPAAAGANHVTVGRAERTVTGGSNDGDVECPVRAGIFLWETSDTAGRRPGRADIGDTVYAEDDRTVGKAGLANAQKAGRIFAIDDAGVWVATGIAWLF